jgi:hypothetical protein
MYVNVSYRASVVNLWMGVVIGYVSPRQIIQLVIIIRSNKHCIMQVRYNIQYTYMSFHNSVCVIEDLTKLERLRNSHSGNVDHGATIPKSPLQIGTQSPVISLAPPVGSSTPPTMPSLRLANGGHGSSGVAGSPLFSSPPMSSHAITKGTLIPPPPLFN